MMLAEFYNRCEKCGCTEQNACYDEVTGHGCSWARRPTATAPGLCSVCSRPIGVVTHAQAMANLVRRTIAKTCDRSYIGTRAETPIASKLTPAMRELVAEQLAAAVGVAIPHDRWQDFKTVGDVIAFVHSEIRREYVGA